MENSDWQSQLSTLKERTEYAFDKSLFCDVEFSVVDSNGVKVTIPANKYILAISSPVFEAMFYGQFAESHKSTVDITDCTKEGLYELLLYVSTDEVNLTGSNVMEVMYLANKYMMPFLEKTCYEFLGKDLSPEDAFTVLSQAQKSCNAEAEELCWNVVDFETRRAVRSEAFLNISHELLKQVLERETLHTDEVNLFKATDCWAANKIGQDESLQCDGNAKRAVLGDDLVRLIRFPVMSQKEFAEIVLVSEVLRGNEVTEIVQVFNSVAPSQTSFPCTKRQGQWSERWSENRFNAVAVAVESNAPFFYSKPARPKSRSYRADKVDRNPETELENHSTVLRVNKPIFLAGVRLFGEAYSAKGSITLIIVKRSYKHPIFQTSFSCESKAPQKIDNSYSAYTIMIDTPVLLEPNEEYIVRASMKSPYLGSGGKSVIQIDDIEITLQNAVNSATTVECGQFPSFLLKRKLALRENRQLSSPVPTTFSDALLVTKDEVLVAKETKDEVLVDEEPGAEGATFTTQSPFGGRFTFEAAFEAACKQ